jgi:hypothetical protein
MHVCEHNFSVLTDNLPIFNVWRIIVFAPFLIIIIKSRKRRIAPLMVTYHYVKFYVSINIQLEAININVRNFKLPIGFYSDIIKIWYVGR